MSLEFGILGPLQVLGEAGPVRLGGRRQRAVLAILLLRANRVVPVEQIADELYDAGAPATAVAQVRDHVSQLRKLLGTESDALETQSPGYALRLDTARVDAYRFEQLLEEATSTLRAGEAERAAQQLREALGLWRGPALAEFADDGFARATAGRLEELRLTAVEQRIEADLVLGRDGRLVSELEELVAQHPLRERLRGQLMLALYRAGRQAEAVRTYHEMRETLDEELGLEPSPELRELMTRMLREDPSLRPSPPAAPMAEAPVEQVRNPYKGLRAFGEADADDFFGREGLTERLVRRIAETRFLALVGPSGSGKSSVLHAGLVPALRSRPSLHVVKMSPGAYPLEELEAALLRIAVNPPPSLVEQLEADERGLLRAVKRALPADDSDLLLIVDQLEEVFTLVDDETRRAHFLAILESAVRDPHSRLRVAATIRADFYDRPLLHRGFAELFRDRTEVVLPLTPDEVERAITGPARRAGLLLEEGLLAEIVADVLDEPGALPLLQYALTELVEQREGAMLTRAGYEAIGGVSGALAGRAESLYRGLGADGQEAARRRLCAVRVEARYRRPGRPRAYLGPARSTRGGHDSYWTGPLWRLVERRRSTDRRR